MKSADGILKYDKLAQVMLAILSIPHSNAECERMFSAVTNTKTLFSSMLPVASLEKFLVLKSVQKGKCFEQKFSSEFLKLNICRQCIKLANMPYGFKMPCKYGLCYEMNNMWQFISDLFMQNLSYCQNRKPLDFNMFIIILNISSPESASF